MSTATRVVTLTIDEKEVSASDDQTILDIARENGISITTLCQMDGLSTVGACRLCLIEVAGVPRLLSACTTTAAEGMVVSTTSERLQRYRRGIIELLFAERNHVCAVCVANGCCELQELARDLGITHITYPYMYPDCDVDASHERFVVDHNRCVLCARCLRVCDEIEGAHTWDMTGRGTDTRVITDLNRPWAESESCTSCGKCTRVCPTGALYEKNKSPDETKGAKTFLPYLTRMREAQP